MDKTVTLLTCCLLRTMLFSGQIRLYKSACTCSHQLPPVLSNGISTFSIRETSWSSLSAQQEQTNLAESVLIFLPALICVLSKLLSESCKLAHRTE